jgi:putative sigma-54 modulation protein
MKRGNIVIKGHGVKVTHALRAYVHDKLSPISRHSDLVMSTRVCLAVRKLKEKGLRHHVSITLRAKSGKKDIRGSEIFLKEARHDMYGAIDVLTSKLDRRVSGYKDGLKSHGRSAVANAKRAHCVRRYDVPLD